MNMRQWLNNRLKKVAILLSFFTLSAMSAEPELGVAVDPMKITVEPGRMVYFTVVNETERDYIITTKVISDISDEKNKAQKSFFVNPPIRLLKKRDRDKMGVAYLGGAEAHPKGTKYYLSVSFTPKISGDKNVISIPIRLVQQIPIYFK